MVKAGTSMFSSFTSFPHCGMVGSSGCVRLSRLTRRRGTQRYQNAAKRSIGQLWVRYEDPAVIPAAWTILGSSGGLQSALLTRDTLMAFYYVLRHTYVTEA
ncbi:hypothetical protein IG631_04919 [Alternaria alternata]|nr:hypothetical protein IG631_04919 [Alternaria alternata]